MKLVKVQFTCPQCGKTWTEMQDPEDDWFKLGTSVTLCAKCGLKAIEKITGEWEDENLSCWPRSHG